MKIEVLREVRSITGLGLKEAKDLVEAAPKNVIEGVSRNEAKKIKATLEEVGATVEIKSP
jgi:large subunit ribosomal protein L7/L12